MSSDGPWHAEAPYVHLVGCSRCGRLHGNGDEPPFGWVPLINPEFAVGLFTFWGVVCPDCRVAIGDGTITLIVARPTMRVVQDTAGS